MSVLLLFGLVVLLSVLKNPYRERWKKALRIALLMLSASCIAINSASRALDLGFGSEVLATSITPGGYIILGLTLITVSVLVVGFGREVLSMALKEQIERYAAGPSTEDAAAAATAPDELPIVCTRTLGDARPEVALPQSPDTGSSIGTAAPLPLRTGAETLASLASLHAFGASDAVSPTAQPDSVARGVYSPESPESPARPNPPPRLPLGLGAAASLLIRAVRARRRVPSTVHGGAASARPLPGDAAPPQPMGGFGAVAALIKRASLPSSSAVTAAAVGQGAASSSGLGLMEQRARGITGAVAGLLRRAAGPAASYRLAPDGMGGVTSPDVTPSPPLPVGIGAVASLVRRAAGPGADTSMGQFSDINTLAPRLRSPTGERGVTPDIESGELGREARPVSASGEPADARSAWGASVWIPALVSPGTVARQHTFSSLGETRDRGAGASLASPPAGRPTREIVGRPGSVQRSPPHGIAVFASDGLAAAASSLLSRHPAVGSPPVPVLRPTRRHSVGPALAWAPHPISSSVPHTHGIGGELGGSAVPPPIAAVHLGSDASAEQWPGPTPGGSVVPRTQLCHAASSMGFSDPLRGENAIAMGLRGSRRASFSSLAGHGSSTLWAMPTRPPAPADGTSRASRLIPPSHTVMRRRRSSIDLIAPEQPMLQHPLLF